MKAACSLSLSPAAGGEAPVVNTLRAAQYHASTDGAASCKSIISYNHHGERQLGRAENPTNPTKTAEPSWLGTRDRLVMAACSEMP
ncbi:hypothetical protein ANO14919_115030 [Xylariales sp. No.14919]|nr:hypothetical protein ANO14919_115030 [Xylariales sp. No.14919]